MERIVRRALAVLTLSTSVLLAGATFGTAAPDDPPVSGDPRATAISGNVTTCAGAGLPGVEIKVTSHITENTYIDITAVPSGYTVTGVIVKGGPAYNKYPNLGALPWNDLHAPLVPSGKPAEISHWFVCATKDTTTTTTKTTTTTTKTTTSTTGTSTSSTTSTKTSGGGSSVTTTTKPVVVANESNTSGLASTGFAGGPYLLVGGLLLIGGLIALLFARRRRSS
ncbi:hypothetical protein [Actinocrispum sp. NPDC049592]|uniref:hypothetical protein n=1 Tax=Actinocrispum sp. NPDC049592 TaxID=3154835 RepID=UPI00342E751E